MGKRPVIIGSNSILETTTVERRRRGHPGKETKNIPSTPGSGQTQVAYEFGHESLKNITCVSFFIYWIPDRIKQCTLCIANSASRC